MISRFALCDNLSLLGPALAVGHDDPYHGAKTWLMERTQAGNEQVEMPAGHVQERQPERSQRKPKQNMPRTWMT